jgi:uncharacterized membrane protein (DUF485 family)
MVEEILTYAETPAAAPGREEAVAALVSKKLRFVAVLTSIYMTSYIGLTLLAGFARPVLSAPAIGPVNFGFVLIAANYLIAWGLALIYVRVANRHFDPLAERIVGSRGQ